MRRYFDHRVARDSAALTYYLLFAMFPLLIFLSNLVGFFAVDIEGFLRQLGTIIPAEVLDLLIQYLRYVSRVSSRTLMTFSLIFSIWFPMRAANALLLSVRKAYGMGASHAVPPPSGQGVPLHHLPDPHDPALAGARDGGPQRAEPLRGLLPFQRHP